ncbi:MAG: lysophospholipid acyltransferase family protein [Flavobacteriales bacterium]
MKKILTIIQAILIGVWTMFCGLFGMLLLLFTWNQRFVMLVMSHYIWSPVICAVSGVRIEKQGLENIDKKNSAIYVANHSSLFDIVAVCRASPVPLFYVAKIELKKIPIMGHFMSAVGMIFIDRKNKERAMQSMRLAGEKIKNGKNIISFPEGTRSKDGNVQLFRRGSFIIAKSGDIPIQPISIKGAYEVLSAGTSNLNSGRIKVYFHPPILASDYGSMSEEVLAEHCRKIVDSKIASM